MKKCEERSFNQNLWKENIFYYLEVNLFTKEEMQKREMQVKHQCEAVSQFWIVGYSAGKKRLSVFSTNQWHEEVKWVGGEE